MGWSARTCPSHLERRLPSRPESHWTGEAGWCESFHSLAARCKSASNPGRRSGRGNVADPSSVLILPLKTKEEKNMRRQKKKIKKEIKKIRELGRGDLPTRTRREYGWRFGRVEWTKDPDEKGGHGLTGSAGDGPYWPSSMQQSAVGVAIPG